MAIWGMVSSSNPAREAYCPAVCSILLTLSRDESRVKVIRLVVESAKAVLAISLCQSSTADTSDDGSVLVEAPNVKDARFIFLPIVPPFSAHCHHLVTTSTKSPIH